MAPKSGPLSSGFEVWALDSDGMIKNSYVLTGTDADSRGHGSRVWIDLEVVKVTSAANSGTDDVMPGLYRELSRAGSYSLRPHRTRRPGLTTDT